MNKFYKYIKLLISYFIGLISKREPNIWILGEWFGLQCSDNCKYFANYLAENHKSVRVYFFTSSKSDITGLNKGIKVVYSDTKEFNFLLRKASVVIVNQNLMDICYKNFNLYMSGAISFNFWHGVPWKKIGVDSFNGVSDWKNIIDYAKLKLLCCHNWLSLSPAMNDILSSSYPIYNIIEAGYPRNSLFYSSESINGCRKKILNIINDQFKFELVPNIKLITYMPTFRDRDENTFSFKKLLNNERFCEILKKYNCLIIQKAHFVSNERGAYRSTIDNFRIVNLNDVASQELLAATDMLITDYSSCFFDFLLLDRPIIHYLYDYDYYANQDRGLYYKKEDVVCGSAPETEDELLDAIEENLKRPDLYRDLRQERKKKYLTYESPDSCEIIYQAIIEELKKRYK